MASGHTFTIKEKGKSVSPPHCRKCNLNGAGGGEINYDDNYEMPDYSGLAAYQDAYEEDDSAFMGLFGHNRPERQVARTQIPENEAEGDQQEEDGRYGEDEEVCPYLATLSQTKPTYSGYQGRRQ